MGKDNPTLGASKSSYTPYTKDDFATLVSNAKQKNKLNPSKPVDDDSFLTNVGEGFEQGGKALIGGVGYAAGVFQETFTDNDFEAEKLKLKSERYVASAPESDDSWGQFFGSVIPSAIPTIAAVASSGGVAAVPIGYAALATLGMSATGSGMMEYDQYKRSVGEKSDPLARLGVGLLYGGLEFATEKIALGKLGAKGGKMFFKSNMKAAEKAGKDNLLAFIKQNPKKAWPIVKKIAYASNVEGIQEGITSLGQDLTDFTYRKVEDYATAGEIVTNMRKSYGAGAVMGFGIAPVSFMAQNKAHKNRRAKQGRVIIGKDLAKGTPVEVMGQGKAEGTFAVMSPEGEMYELNETEVTGREEVTDEQFSSLLKNKGDETTQLNHVRHENEVLAREGRIKEVGEYADKYAIDGEDGQGNAVKVIKRAVWVDDSGVPQKVHVGAGIDEKLIAITITDKDGGTNIISVDRTSLKDIESMPVEAIAQNHIGPESQFNSSVIGRGDTVRYNFPTMTENGVQEIPIEFTVSGANAETGEVTLNITVNDDGLYDPAGDVEAVTVKYDDVDKINPLQKEQKEVELDDDGGIAPRTEVVTETENVPELKTRELVLEDKKTPETFNAILDDQGKVAEIDKTGMKKKQAEELATRLNEEYPKLEFEVVDRTGEEETAKADFRVVRKQPKKQPDESESVKGRVEKEIKGKEELFDLVDQFNAGETKLRPEINTLADDIKVNITFNAGGVMQITNLKSGQEIKRQTKTNEKTNTDKGVQPENDSDKPDNKPDSVQPEEVESQRETAKAEKEEAKPEEKKPEIKQPSNKESQPLSKRPTAVKDFVDYHKALFENSGENPFIEIEGIEGTNKRSLASLFEDVGSANPSEKVLELLNQIEDIVDSGFVNITRKEQAGRLSASGTQSIPLEEYYNSAIFKEADIDYTQDQADAQEYDQWFTNLTEEQKNEELTRLYQEFDYTPESNSIEADQSGASQEKQPERVEQKPKVEAKTKPEAKPEAKEEAKPESKPEQRIDDVGEKLEGARKDLQDKHAQALEDATEESLLNNPLGKVLPEVEYKELVEKGLATPREAAFLQYFRKELSKRKPSKRSRSSAKNKWLGHASLYKSVLGFILNKKDFQERNNGSSAIDLMEKRLPEYSRDEIFGYVDLIVELGFPNENINLGNFNIKVFDQKISLKEGKVVSDKKGFRHTIVNGYSIVADFKTREEAVTALKYILKSTSNAKKSKAVKFDMWTSRGKKGTFLGKKVGTGKFIELKRFDTTKEANEYRKNNQEELEALLAEKKQIAPDRPDSLTPRKGKDHRNGKNVTAEDFQNKFGFRGVQFGNYVNQSKRQGDINQAYDALMDLSEVTGIPPEAIALGGKLGIAFGARGRGGKGAASAHYESDSLIINLTRDSGAGSLAHEWWHAVDNYFSRQRGVKTGFITESPRTRKVQKTENGKALLVDDDSIRPEMINAFKKVVDAISKSGLPKRSAGLDQKRTKDYYTKIIEMTARSFESYVLNTLEQKGNKNDYLVSFKDVVDYILESGADENVYPYPTQEESPSIYEAYDNFFNTVKTDDKGGLFQLTQEEIPILKGTDKTNAASMLVSPLRVKQKDRVEGVVNKITEGWKNAPEVVVWETGLDFAMNNPGNFKNQHQISGVYLDGKIHLIASHGQLKTKDGVLNTLLHEALGHFGVRGMVSQLAKDKQTQYIDELNTIMDKVYESYKSDPRLLELKRLYEQRGSEKQYQRELAEEFIAHQAQTGVEASLLDDIANWFRRIYREITGNYLKISDSEIRGLISNSRNFVSVGDNFIDRNVFRAQRRDINQTSMFDSPVQNDTKTKRDVVNAQIKTATSRLKELQKLQSQFKSPTRLIEIQTLQSEIVRLNDQLANTLKREDATKGGEQASLFQRAAPTDSKEFKKWFGDSKVVNEDGSPMVVYHGTGSDFNVFDASEAGKSTGNAVRNNLHWFSKDISTAEGFAKKAAWVEKGAESIIPSYLSVQNPLEFDAEIDKISFTEAYEQAIRNGNDGLVIKNTPDSVHSRTVYSIDGVDLDYIDSRGAFDEMLEEAKSGDLGVIDEVTFVINELKADPNINDKGNEHIAGEIKMWERIREAFRDEPNKIKERVVGITDVYGVFNPTQIKSATGNSGQFDGNNPDIRFQRVNNPTDNFFSNSINAMASIPMNKATGDQWKAMLIKNGGNQHELEWIGFDDFIKANPKPTKQEVLDFISSNQIKVVDVLKGSVNIWTQKGDDYTASLENHTYSIKYNATEIEEPYSLFRNSSNIRAFETIEEAKEAAIEIHEETYGTPAIETKYSSYTVPGGENYKELLLTMPSRIIPIEKITELPEGYSVSKNGNHFSVIPPNQNHGKPFNGLHDTIDQAKKAAIQQINLSAEYDASQKSRDNQYKSSHFNDPNILAHIRFDERTDSEGKKVLFVQEVQSDWSQDGRKKGFIEKWKPNNLRVLSDKETAEQGAGHGRMWLVEALNEQGQQEQVFQILKSKVSNKGEVIDYIINNHTRSGEVPNTPFKQTSQWLNLAMKRMIRYAADNNFDKIAFINGEQAAGLYDLSKQVEDIMATPNPDGTYTLAIDIKGGLVPQKYESQTPEQMEALIGKEITRKIVNNEGTQIPRSNPRMRKNYHYEGNDLKVGGEGMKTFYDSIVPKTASKLLKKFDKTARVGSVEIESGVPSERIVDRQLEDGIGWEVAVDNSARLFKTEKEALEYIDTLENSKTQQQSFEITPALRQKSTQEGMPMFQRQPLLENTKEQANAILDNVTRKMQDMFIDLRRMQEQKVKEGGILEDSMDAYTQENLSVSKITNQQGEFDKNLKKPLIDLVISMKVKEEEVAEYLKAKHAPERNAYFREKYEKDLDDDSEDNMYSGYTDEQANGIIDAFEAKVDPAKVTQLHEKVKNIVDFNNNKQLNDGLINQKRFDSNQKQYKYYVPLRGFDVVEYDPTVFSGNKAAKGRKSDAGDPLAYLLAMATTTIVHGERNKVKIALLEFVKANPDNRIYNIKNIWFVKTDRVDTDGKPIWTETIYKPSKEQFENGEVKKSYDPDSETLEESQFNKDTLTVLVAGKKVNIEFIGEGVRVVEALKKTNLEKVPKYLGVMRDYLAFLRGSYTQYSPEFAFRNFFRDVFAGTLNVRTDYGNAAAAKVVSGVGSSMNAIRKAEYNNDYNSGDSVTVDGKSMTTGQLYREFKDEGAVTGWSDIKDVSTHQKELKTAINALKGSKLSYGKEQLMKILRPIDDVNRVVENTVRFSTYRTLREKGLSKQKAAIYAKDVTVNFNRKGEWSSGIASLWLFFNASVQGGSRLAKPFFSDDKAIRNRAIGTAMALPAIAAALSMVNRLVGGEDEDGEYYYDKLSEHSRNHNLIIPNMITGKKGDFIQVPLPYGFNFFTGVGDHAMRSVLGKESPTESTMKVASLMLGSFSPLGSPDIADEDMSGAEIASRFLPTAIQPIMDQLMNKNFAGIPIYKEPFMKGSTEIPDSEQYFSNVNPIFKHITTALNKATGGDREVSGAIDVNPETVEQAFMTVGGGIFTFANNIASTAAFIAEGENPISFDDNKIKKVPFLRGYVNAPSSHYNSGLFYDNVQEVEDVEAVYKRYLKSGNKKRALEYRKENNKLFRIQTLADNIKNQIKSIRDKQKNLESHKNNPMVDKRLKALEEQENKLYIRFNGYYSKAMNNGSISASELLGL